MEEITFYAETQKPCIDSKDGKEKPDKIDIYINKLGLLDEWQEHEEHIYIAIECKRIVDARSYSEYLTGIQKMTERSYTNLRLPFEGMIGFIEDYEITHTLASKEISKKLENSKIINTKQYLVSTVLNADFNASYTSIHTKNFGEKSDFTLYHLFFDYSANVID